jgi:hypothetical protein
LFGIPPKFEFIQIILPTAGKEPRKPWKERRFGETFGWESVLKVRASRNFLERKKVGVRETYAHSFSVWFVSETILLYYLLPAL